LLFKIIHLALNIVVMADDKKIVALCGPDGPLSLVIYTSTILVYFNWLNRAIRVDCVCPIL
jgi:hypothetical protein